ncbi:5-formyltetrahydrofolate cyclo-ligase [Aliihoeflea aestuarii]|jgi:5-formyltetrahydrofolate cyclo-ligase|uniref:5-formyltetrahydrofolate cyclo-ligase n=1 Tax=Aliihoeflea aestuarii TaxID=453840 RepID=UPI0020938DF3|nr:5-formyltetrahydrofolate cyclo-ligase [Aliihoeflea aestuarii]MCO6391291.1 5-formyltetrahydrofolate cyclo-ligase [Aliihoeflea aestuarii]
MNHRELKKALRVEALARRDGLEPQWRIEASISMARAADRLATTPGMVVSGFWPMRSEVDVRPLMAALADRGVRLCLPAIIDKQTIVFRELKRGGEMIDMGFGTWGPGPDAPELTPELMLVPLAAFDARGHRIGYGAGYYDRAIERMQANGHTPRLVAIAFDCQEVDEVPEQPHDVQLGEILTESGLRAFPQPLGA